MKKLFWLVLALVCFGLGIVGVAGYWYFQHYLNTSVVQTIVIPDQKITFPEGWRTEEMAQRLQEKGVLASAGAYLSVTQSAVTAPELRVAYKIPANAPLTGFLFPDTYLFLLSTDATDVVQKQIASFQSRTADLKLTYDTIILASIVEREAKFDGDRSQIAGVYSNRLKIGMALQADPTVQIAKFATQNLDCLTAAGIDSQACQNIDWWPTVLRSDLQGIKSPYNTYLNPGLPPQPICNPGLASLEAASAPAEHDYLYFVSDKEGHAHFAKTLAEHNANVAKYR
jgi:UPF0755 protein